MILKLIVEHFIKTAQPVGSQTLLDEYKLNYSSATIRNEMNTLEKEGFLEKTHTSSGRVPSKKGYEYYVEHLREDRIDEEVKYALAAVLAPADSDALDLHVSRDVHDLPKALPAGLPPQRGRLLAPAGLRDVEFVFSGDAPADLSLFVYQKDLETGGPQIDSQKVLHFAPLNA